MPRFRTEYEQELYEQIVQETESSPVRQHIRCHAFVSRSKGIRKSGPRKGQRRFRGGHKEVVLVSHYRRFYQFHLAPLDEWVGEVYEGNDNPFVDADYLREQIKTEFQL